MNSRSTIASRIPHCNRLSSAGRSSRAWAFACSILLSYAIPVSAQERIFRIEVYPIASEALTTGQMLAGEQGQPITVAGELRLPAAGDEQRLPAVIMMHGAGGVYGNADAWADAINDLGVAVFILDSFSGRGFINPTAVVGQTKDAAAVSGLVMIVDAYRALALLAKHPRIDPGRIALMGFSRGGITALYASLTRFQQQYGPPGVQFAAYVPVYPLCSYALADDERLSGGPVRIFHGTADNITPIDSCRRYVERLRRAGRDIQITEYSGAHHGYDMAVLSEPRNYPELQNFGGCFFEERPRGTLVNADTGKPVSATDACVSRGATLGYDPSAYAATRKAVRELMLKILLNP
jgi:dienelactone hydrolase